MSDVSPHDAFLMRRNFRATWLSAIQQYADSPSQQSRWLETQHDIDQLPEGCIMAYFENAYVPAPHVLDYGRLVGIGFLSVAEADAVRDFHAAAEAYRAPDEDYFNGPAVVADPAWQAVVAEAQTAQQRLLDLIDDPRERKLLATPLEWVDRGDGLFSSDCFGTFKSA